MTSEKSKYRKIPKHNKLRLVYAVDKSGKPISYIHVENSEAQKIFDILAYIRKSDDWIPMNKIIKDIKKYSYSAVQYTLTKIAGVLWIDMIGDEGHSKLFNGEILYLKKEMYNTKRNLNPALNYLKPTIYVRRACT